MLLGPEIKREGGQIVHLWNSATIFGQIDALDVRLTSVTSLNPRLNKFLGRKKWQLVFVLLPAVRTKNASKFPFCRAERADQRAPGAVIEFTQHG